MNELEQTTYDDSVRMSSEQDEDAVEIPVCDDRYPGSFFTIPAPVIVGKTAWSLT